jgi:MFS family permease
MTAPDPNATSPRHAPMGFVEFLTFCSAGMAINSLAVSIMLAALPEIASAYAMADANRQQLVLTVFFTGFSIGQIGVGMFSDRFGRRATFLFGMVVYCVATVACVFAPTFEILLIARFLAGMASAVPRVVVVSAVRDCYVGRRMASLMSLVMTVLFVAPILAPTLGHLILLGSNWQVLFGILLIHGVVMLGWSWARQPETQKAEDVRPIRFAPFMAAVKAFFLNRQSVLVTLASGACQGLQPLDDGHVGHAAAFAHRLQAVALAALLQRVHQRGHQLGARAAQRMPQRNRAAIDVEPRPDRPPTSLQPGHRHRGEGLVDLEQVDVVDLHAGLLQRALRWPAAAPPA